MTDAPLVDLKEVVRPPVDVVHLYDIDGAARLLTQVCPLERRQQAIKS